MKEWFTKYPKTIVVRHNNSTLANNAANWANSQFGTGGPSSNKTYKVTVGALKDSFNLSTLYCSLIIWQAYYKSGATLLVGSPAMPDQFVSLASNNNMKTHMKIGY
ncbi:hypothetical protein [Sporosarcina aquimarina]|uniref:Uncharacterized protein n=1 Tax=Sporosarcina aquimarina TaxID=114975 RepID=A0ABU4FZA8_9BACL|nr:hypothetical protein [Sporosarcina aquimarina]MDW0110053.1 hypothetical protein [Sporosarcina aquimarina]